MRTRVCKVGTIAWLDARVVLELKHFILDTHTVLAINAAYFLTLFQIAVQVCVKELWCVHVANILRHLFHFGLRSLRSSRLRRHQCLCLATSVLHGVGYSNCLLCLDCLGLLTLFPAVILPILGILWLFLRVHSYDSLSWLIDCCLRSISVATKYSS